MKAVISLSESFQLASLHETLSDANVSIWPFHKNKTCYIQINSCYTLNKIMMLSKNSCVCLNRGFQLIFKTLAKLGVPNLHHLHIYLIRLSGIHLTHLIE